MPHHVLWLGRFRERRKNVRLEQDDNKPKIAVIIKVARRNDDGRITYETHDSFNIVETTAQEVSDVINKAFGRRTAVAQKGK
jgi:hypothetical protein